jgi:hypothetical protein
MLKIDSYPTAKTLIDSIKLKKDNELPLFPNLNDFLFPIITLTASIDRTARKSDPATAKTIKYRKSDIIAKSGDDRRDSK